MVTVVIQPMLKSELISYDFPVGQDSSFFSVDSPFLTAKDFAIDYWFKAEGDTLLPYIRMIIRSASNNHVDQNYYIRVEPNYQLSARYQVDPSVDTRTQSDIALISATNVFSLDKWVHVLYERDDTAAVFEIRNEDDVLVERMVNTETAQIHLVPHLSVKNWMGCKFMGWRAKKLNGQN